MSQVLSAARTVEARVPTEVASTVMGAWREGGREGGREEGGEGCSQLDNPGVHACTQPLLASDRQLPVLLPYEGDCRYSTLPNVRIFIASFS